MAPHSPPGAGERPPARRPPRAARTRAAPGTATLLYVECRTMDINEVAMMSRPNRTVRGLWTFVNLAVDC
ncbi:hypothetical protein EVAR_8959_1 [Eumeta japonica]|uniref:Uncharacterized protein n=1 Tax=Eumeta variegata TaxID=151549 RepID=A0A4C1U0S1_EUMVA|nr:hypothetical protein EVAR_8959_1 [Eumeta japonica]